MRKTLALACFAAGLAATQQASAYTAGQCKSFLIGGWELANDPSVVVAFGADGNLKRTASGREEWSKWSAADGDEDDACEITTVNENGRSEIATFTLADEDTFRVKNQAYRRTAGSGQAIREAKADTASAAVDCATYFIGSWISTNEKGTRFTRIVFDGYGRISVVEGKVGAPVSDDDAMKGSWRGAAGAKAGWCTVFLTGPDGEKEGQLQILGVDSFSDPVAKATFTRE